MREGYGMCRHGGRKKGPRVGWGWVVGVGGAHLVGGGEIARLSVGFVVAGVVAGVELVAVGCGEFVGDTKVVGGSGEARFWFVGERAKL